MRTSKPTYEQLGAFYLGRGVDPESKETLPEDILYDASDLTTHALCVGMTGSGKTGLCVSLLEEALLDGVPVIAIDPKGDLGNLLLTFPDLAADDFAPWIDPQSAARRGTSQKAEASRVSKQWREGLQAWGQDGERIERLRQTADMTIYTPGSRVGRPLSVLRSLSMPQTAAGGHDPDLRERVSTTVSSLLALAGVASDPFTGREHILLSQLLERAWTAGEKLDLGGLVQGVMRPGFARIGVLDLDTFYPERDRQALAMQLNGLLASPSLAAWLAGEPLDIDRLLFTEAGKPRLSILSIAHLSDAERMFFVTLLLGEVIAWMRKQPGTPSLRAIVYMDEVFGFLPPVAEPPSKRPMITLLKQARAFGVGLVLATQNPVDVDYKALTNCGTWFIGRLQAQRDKDRVLDGLQSAVQSSGKAMDRASLSDALSSLPSRTFVLHNVHEDSPVSFRSRWAMSYLAGPLTLPQIATLSPPAGDVADAAGAPATAEEEAEAAEQNEPAVPAHVPVRYLAALPTHGTRVYRPALMVTAQLHYADKRRGIDIFRDVVAVAPLVKASPSKLWESLQLQPEGALDVLQSREEDTTFAPLPPGMLTKAKVKSLGKAAKTRLYRDCTLELPRCKSLKLVAEEDETAAQFAGRVAQAAREARDLRLGKLRGKYETKFKRIQERIRKAEAKVSTQEGQLRDQSMRTAVSVGTSLLGALFGRRKLSTGAGRAVTGASRIGRERGDVERAKADVVALQDQLRALEADFEAAVEETTDAMGADAHPIETLSLRPRKSELHVGEVTLLFRPYARDADGETPAFVTEP